MTRLTKTMIAALLFGLGFASSQLFLSDQYVKMQVTKSGIFVINDGQIYTVNELFEGEKQEVAFNSHSRNLK